MKYEILDLIMNKAEYAWLVKKNSSAYGYLNTLHNHIALIDNEGHVWTFSRQYIEMKKSFINLNFIVKSNYISSIDIAGKEQSQYLMSPGLNLGKLMNIKEMLSINEISNRTRKELLVNFYFKHKYLIEQLIVQNENKYQIVQIEGEYEKFKRFTFKK
jgi:hypothetical protein